MPKSVLRAILERMQFTLHETSRTPHGASGLVQAMSSWLVKTRRAPSRHSRDARVYGHTTTAMHKLSTHTPSFHVLRILFARFLWLLPVCIPDTRSHSRHPPSPAYTPTHPHTPTHTHTPTPTPTPTHPSAL